MNFKNINLEKGMYHHPEKSFSQILEELDPSENYAGTNLEKLDAFQRQLKRFDIKVNGINCDYINKFFSNTQSAALLPEFFSRTIRNEILNNKVLDQIIAGREKINSLTYNNILMEWDDEKNFELKETKPGDAFPETIILTDDKPINLTKKGRILNASCETFWTQKINAVSIALRQIGKSFVNAIVADGIKVLLNGHDEKNKAKEFKTEKENELSYEDLLKVWSEFENCDMNTIIVNPKDLSLIAKIPEFQNPLSRVNLQTSGTLATPLGANIIKTKAMKQGHIILMDKTISLLQIVAKSITVDSDKLIDKQIERIAVYTIYGFAKFYSFGSYVLKL